MGQPVKKPATSAEFDPAPAWTRGQEQAPFATAGNENGIASKALVLATLGSPPAGSIV
jgi:hypothetical protein